MNGGKVDINAPLTVNGPVYANGPVYIQGMDIKKELEEVKIKLESIDKEYEKRLVEILELVSNKVALKEDERNAIKTVINGTDWAQRLVFWHSCVRVLTPFVRIVIYKLLGI